MIESSYYLVLPYAQLLGTLIWPIVTGAFVMQFRQSNYGVAEYGQSVLWLLPLVFLFSMLPFVIWGPLYRRREVPEAVELDERVLHALASGRFSELDSLPPELLERARPDADLRHLEVLRGFLLMDTPGVVIEHELLPGIGTALVEFPLENTGVAG